MMNNGGVQACFLCIDDDKPLGVFVATETGCVGIDLEWFLTESKIDMSKDIARRYAERFKAFAEELEEYAGEPELEKDREEGDD